MAGRSNGIFDYLGPADATLGHGCSIIWQEDIDERHIFSRGSRVNSWGQELTSDDRVFSVRVPRG